MPKALIHYFSGTGNSLLASKQLSQELVKYGYETVFHAIEDGLYNADNTYSLHIFVFPIYATATPHIMLRYIRNLPKGANAKVAILSTNGRISTVIRDGYQGWALHQAKLYLRLKEYNVFFSDTLDYPHNVTVIIPPRNDTHNEIIISKASAKLPSITEQIAKNQKYHRSFFLPNIAWSLPFGILFTCLGRRFLGKMYIANSSCTSCNLCVNSCPVKAIQSSHRKLKWKWNCEGCMRCINICPRHAIQVSGVRMIAIISAFFANPYFLIHNSSIGFLQKFGGIGRFVINAFAYSISYIVAFLLLDWFIDKISYVPIIRKIVSFGHTRFYGRYHAARFEHKFLNKR